MAGGQQVPRRARPFVAVFLAAIVVCAVLRIEAWPLTAWQLFSHQRSDAQAAWVATAVYPGGEERPYPLGALARGYRGFPFLMSEFEAGSPERRAAICAAWLDGTEVFLGSRAREVRIYQDQWLLSERVGDRAAPPQRGARYTCGSDGAIDAGV